MSNLHYLVTGGAGFVGHHVVAELIKSGAVTIIDSLNYSGSLDRLREIKIHPDLPNSSTLLDKVRVINWDLRVEAEPNLIKELQDVTHIIHMAAESHVDSSIEDPMKFVMANVVGTTNILQAARKLPKLEKFLHFSTDEVFGPAPFDEKGFWEESLHDPKNPYAATKSAAGQMVNAFANTYQLPCIETFTMNVFGERQHKEKFIPKCISAAIDGSYVPIHGTPDKTQAGVRSYIHGSNVAKAVKFLLHEVEGGTNLVPRFNIVGEEEIDNLSLALIIDEMVGELGPRYGYKPKGLEWEIVDFHSSRPGHDLRYALDGRKLKNMGFKYPSNFQDSLRSTIRWYLENARV